MVYPTVWGFQHNEPAQMQWLLKWWLLGFRSDVIHTSAPNVGSCRRRAVSNESLWCNPLQLVKSRVSTGNGTVVSGGDEEPTRLLWLDQRPNKAAALLNSWYSVNSHFLQAGVVLKQMVKLEHKLPDISARIYLGLTPKYLSMGRCCSGWWRWWNIYVVLELGFRRASERCWATVHVREASKVVTKSGCTKGSLQNLNSSPGKQPRTLFSVLQTLKSRLIK